MNTMTVSEICMHCMGFRKDSEQESWQHPDGGDWFSTLDYTIGDPIADAQYGNIMRLREKAIEYRPVAFYEFLEKRRSVYHGAGMDVVFATLKEMRDAAIDTLIADTPKNVQEAWEQMNG